MAPSRSSPRKRKAVNYSETGAQGNGDEDVKPSPRKVAALTKRRSAHDADAQSPKAESKTAKKPRTGKAEKDEQDAFVETGYQSPETKPAKRARKSQAGSKDDDAAATAERTAVESLKRAMYIGAHVSASGGVHNVVGNALQIGANSFALFLKSQRKWTSPSMTPEARAGFVDGCRRHGYSAHEHALPHGSYLVNLAQADPDKARQAYESFVDDLQRCEQLGIRLYNFHPGSTGGADRAEAIARIAAQLNRAHAATRTVVTVLENMAGGGNVVGARWEDLRDIIALVEDKRRVGVCIDTCHAFAAGHDLRTPEAFRKTIDSFNRIVGAEYLKAFHLNDSKAPFNSQRDVHANIGTGFLGLRAFHSIMNHEAFQGMPMVLETPIDREGPDGKKAEDKSVWADEIKLLESLIGMDADTDTFRELEEELQARGASERHKLQSQVDRRAEKDAKKGSRARAKN
ncbi:DNA-(apurinic or apyrimidinic site) lyase 1 [Escovopsis weberi]|uniref:Apurinic-apyrimidinic endonuclease 1 n=1 Tax=Escovopsis weberi TaxID=150374 RepID=A0A0M8N6M4_ESCWE|nr:DNA-(apurinic or apyrimidinic site) lyase 1 [Escovopsis weberi]